MLSSRPVPRGGSAHLRLAVTYTDPDRYRPIGNEMVRDRECGRAINAIASRLPEGRIRLDSLNTIPDEPAVHITARRVTMPEGR